MENYKYIYGPVPSRRLGLSLGVSPIPSRTCNYSCIYCQLGRTKHLVNERKNFFSVDDIIAELEDYTKSNAKYDIITIVGEGEPTLFSDLGLLINKIKSISDAPVAVITNGALLSEKNVRTELLEADFILPSIDASSVEMFKRINRPHGKINYESVINGLINFSKEFSGKIFIETMLIKGENDQIEQLEALKNILEKIDYDRLYINIPVRPPAENHVEEPSLDALNNGVDILNGVSIDQLISTGFFSKEKDDYTAIKSIIKRHPMNQFEIKSFLEERDCESTEKILEKLSKDPEIQINNYKKYNNYRIK
jgi:wyosine [tRNA(Phe)-imidazoG37] synthetase (radical SAM superfamily)